MIKFNFFKLNEFKCKCCGKNEIKEELIILLDNARDIAGIPFKITSGYRCPEHNKKVSGVKDSAHIKGLAADIEVNDSTRFIITKSLIQMGFNRIGIAQYFIHTDIDDSKPKFTLWLY